MSRIRNNFTLVALFGLLPVALSCECDQGPTVTPDQALVDHYYVGNSDSSPGLDSYAPSQPGANPEQAEIDVDFGMVDVSTVADRYLFIRNTGTAQLNVAGVDWVQENGSFVLACFDSGIFKAGCVYTDGKYLVVGPGDDLIMRISYAPTEVGAESASFTITSNANDFPTILVNLAGQGVTPEIQVCISDCEGDQSLPACQAAELICNDDVDPEKLTVLFGDTTTDQVISRQVIINNLGSQDLAVSGIQLQTGETLQFQFQVSEGTLPGIIAAGSQAKLAVSYKPIVGGDHTTDLQIISDDVNEGELSVRLQGRGLAPRVCPDPLSVDFGSVAVGEPEEKFFTITNCGLLDLQVDNLAINPDSSADFSLLNLPVFPVTLVPDESVEVHVQYAPSDRGTDAGGVDIFGPPVLYVGRNRLIW